MDVPRIVFDNGPPGSVVPFWTPEQLNKMGMGLLSRLAFIAPDVDFAVLRKDSMRRRGGVSLNRSALRGAPLDGGAAGRPRRSRVEAKGEKRRAHKARSRFQVRGRLRGHADEADLELTEITDFEIASHNSGSRILRTRTALLGHPKVGPGLRAQLPHRLHRLHELRETHGVHWDDDVVVQTGRTQFRPDICSCRGGSCRRRGTSDGAAPYKPAYLPQL